MSRAALHRAASAAFGALVAGAMFWPGIDVLLSSGVGVAVAASLLFTLRVNGEFPDRLTGERWRDGRWTGASLVVINFGALVGLQLVPLPDGYRAAVSALVLFVGLSAYTVGSLAEMERERGQSARSVPADN